MFHAYINHYRYCYVSDTLWEFPISEMIKCLSSIRTSILVEKAQMWKRNPTEWGKCFKRRKVQARGFIVRKDPPLPGGQGGFIEHRSYSLTPLSHHCIPCLKWPFLLCSLVNVCKKLRVLWYLLQNIVRVEVEQKMCLILESLWITYFAGNGESLEGNIYV